MLGKMVFRQVHWRETSHLPISSSPRGAIKTKGEPKVLGLLLHELLILFVCYSPLPLNRGVTFVTRETWRKLLNRCINQEAYSLSYSKPTNNSYQSACELKFVKVWNLGFQPLWVTRGRFLVIRC